MDTATRLLLTIACVAPLTARAQDLPRGEIVDRVGCRADSSQSYALYLPSGYDPARSWPVIYALDPAARGRVPLERFKSGAETYGYILAGSNDSRNGPLQPSLRSLMAITADVRQRFSVDRQRVYLAGFSGGARAASVFVKARPLPVAGLIAAGAGLGTDVTPRDLGPTYFLGIVGAADFNYREMRELDQRLTSEQVAHRLIVTDGRHDWPSPQTATRAVAWLEMQAMAAGLKPRDPAALGAAFGQEMDLARALETQGDPVGAALTYQGMAAVFQTLRGDDAAEQALRRVQDGEPYRKQLKKEQERDRREEALTLGFQRGLARIYRGLPGEVTLGEVLREMDVSDLVKQVRKAEPADAQLARRLLTILAIESDTQGQRAMEQGEFRRAGLFFEVGHRATELNPRAQADFLYQMACAQSAGGDHKQALATLRQAIEAGFDDRAAVEREKWFEGLRQRPELAEILRRLAEKVPGKEPAAPPGGEPR